MNEQLRRDVRGKYLMLETSLSERGRRLWAGTEANAIGRGGVVLVSKAIGMAISTVRKGRDEVRRGLRPEDLVSDRRRGAGRPRVETKYPQLVTALEKLVSPTTRGDPESSLRWSLKSTRVLAAELKRADMPVSPQKVGALLRGLGYSLQGTSKMKEGTQHPDRNAQFEHIQARTQAHLAAGEPVISVDAKKKEQIGDYGRAGQEWQPKGTPVEVLTYDFHPSNGLNAIPYGVYDVGANTGFVNVGIDHDTPRFAVRSIEHWWELIGKRRYESARRLYITADSGGSNSAVARVWKVQLQDFADRSGLTIEVSHLPPGTSKWNKIEHRLFSFITLNWRGRPLTTYETIISLISATTTAKGLTVKARLDETTYSLGETVPENVMKRLALLPGPLQAKWNYVLEPRTPETIMKGKETHRTVKDIRAKWSTLIAEQVASGLNCTQFCRKRGINYEAFIWARRQQAGVISKNVSKAARRRWRKLKQQQRSDQFQRSKDA
jgi:hypothetical protein